ncbi:Aste57867_9471 [Aphanomyces stellatus]|uniref:Aste57867_9471 protein n=1 Tax=Aphanomyces stellatus TaxID=120398 RepID=A0A485KMZ1_9STRA|nr:hypothetical protein As57867_009434 [Aphanomyces stellatus]VFT86350.1 Aste57867_9471 [Aphanomyces stellatus]
MSTPPSIAPGKAIATHHDVPVFIQRLYNLLEDAPHDIVAWADDGQSFRIYQPTRFAAHVLPLYYSHRKLRTFLRMLNFYGFHRCQSVGAEFSHLNFQRGNFAGLARIERRYKQDLEPEDRAIVEDIEETILSITRMLERERRMDEMVMREVLECLVQTTPPPPSLLPPHCITNTCHSPCATPRPTIATTCNTPAFKPIGQMRQIQYAFPKE